MKKLIVLAALALGLSGCGNSSPLVGKWSGSIAAIPSSDTDTAADKAGKEMAMSLASLMKIEEEFRANGTCSMQAGPNLQEGTYKLSGDKLTQTFDGKAGKPSTVVFDGADKFNFSIVDGPTMVFVRLKK